MVVTCFCRSKTGCWYPEIKGPPSPPPLSILSGQMGIDADVCVDERGGGGCGERGFAAARGWLKSGMTPSALIVSDEATHATDSHWMQLSAWPLGLPCCFARTIALSSGLS